MTAVIASRRTEKPRLATDFQLGMAWWNGLSRKARLAALLAVEPQGRASVAEAFDHWRFCGRREGARS